ncbi:unnamed protein product, partial [Ectocarpus fasciculatus]
AGGLRKPWDGPALAGLGRVYVRHHQLLRRADAGPGERLHGQGGDAKDVLRGQHHWRAWVPVRHGEVDVHSVQVSCEPTCVC